MGQVVSLKRLNGGFVSVSERSFRQLYERLTYDLSDDFPISSLSVTDRGIYYRVQICNLNGLSSDLIDVLATNRYYFENLVKAYVDTVINPLVTDFGLKHIDVGEYPMEFISLVMYPKLRRRHVSSYRAREVFPFEDFPLRGITFRVKRKPDGTLSDKVVVKYQSDMYPRSRSCTLSPHGVSSLYRVFALYLEVEKMLNKAFKSYFKVDLPYIDNYEKFEQMVLARANSYREERL